MPQPLVGGVPYERAPDRASALRGEGPRSRLVVARPRGRDARSASLRADHANLVIACRRIVERHPGGRSAVVDVCPAAHRRRPDDARLARSPTRSTTIPRRERVAAAFADDATVLTIGWPEVAGAALMRRGDVTVLCADSRHEASGFMQRLERFDDRLRTDPDRVAGTGGAPGRRRRRRGDGCRARGV